MAQNKNLDEFIEDIDTEEWLQMDPDERLDFLQQFENAMAETQGRPACKVIPVPDEMDDPGLLGFQNGDIIAINPRYLTSKMRVAGVAQFILPNALQTIAHEGRHAWQGFVIEHPELELVDEETRLAMMMNFENYEGGSNLYSPQLIEMDARYYARQTLEYISKRIAKNKGSVDSDFERAILKAKNGEVTRAMRVMKDSSSAAAIKKAEIAAREKSKKLHPELDFSKVSFFRAIKDLLKDKDINKYTDLRPIKSKGDKMDPGIDDVEHLREIKVKRKKKFL